ncbi:MAG: hypothetical protein HKP21_10035 [Xanthomonadales bacterium]|nr:hypothetical protein [Gammaproteobacteria bacterium]MBT8074035.1 hypothetical protein [Gammaproteobacteria bacterium]NNK04885.1 hypothetical protein [Xanthomonadales bacterium]NNK99494.1 hypothetical protein [Xanthomonadales bacterium]
MKRFLIALGFVLFAGQAPAYFTWGIGEMPCNRFVSAKIEFEHARDQRTHPAQLNWVKGFITGINWSRDSNIARDLTIETVDSWIDGYCRKNLNDSIAEASAALVVHLEGGADKPEAK